MRRLKNRDIPSFRQKLINEQGGKCPLCDKDLTKMKGNVVLDHDHETGLIRGSLCRTCNGAEGKIKTQAVKCATKKSYIDWVIKLGEYLSKKQYAYTHPTHRTEHEKRALKNKRARARYKASKKPKVSNNPVNKPELLRKFKEVDG